MKQLPARICLSIEPSLEDRDNLKEKLERTIETMTENGGLSKWYNFGAIQHRKDDKLGYYSFVSMTLVAITGTTDKYDIVKGFLSKHGL